MTMIDRYIIKRYLLTFFSLVLMFIPIGVLIDLSERIDKIVASKATQEEIIYYYINFSIYFADLLFPLFLFISTIWFTSKLAQNTEIIAILGSGVSFFRMLRPYFLGATFVGILIFVMQMFIVPKASKDYQHFTHTHIFKGGNVRPTNQVFNQINDHEYIYVSSFQPSEKKGYNFTLEHFEGNQLATKITADRIEWVDSLEVYRLYQYKRRNIGKLDDQYEKLSEKDTLLPFKIQDLVQVSYAAETKNVFELNKFIKNERRRGSANVKNYLLVAYRRWMMPFTAFILTLIAVAVSSKKKRGGIGINLTFGMAIAFIYVFFDKIFSAMVVNTSFSPLLAVIIPNIIFGFIAFYMLQRAKK